MRFDGRFVVARRSAGVYCRPALCEPLPAPGDCAFFATEAAAESAGFRPCPRCNLAGDGPAVSRVLAVVEWSGDDRSAAILRLPFEPPYSWESIARFLGPRAIPGVEVVSPLSYRRTIVVDGQHGVVTIEPVEGESCLRATLWPAGLAARPDVVERLRRLFDLGANVGTIARHLSESPILAEATSREPGRRVPGCWDPFELAVRAILGQQVSVAGATTLAGRLATASGDRLLVDRVDGQPGGDGLAERAGLSVVFPTPAALAEADLSRIGLPRARQHAIASLARAVATDPSLLSRRASLGEAIEALRALPGIGDWTAHYIAMRALSEPDAFPASDLGLKHALATRANPAPRPREVLALAECWRPWRAYAAMHLWLAPPPRG